MAEIERARREISYSEERYAYHERMMRERPRLARIYEYWLNWYAERRRNWLTRLWLTECRAWKHEVRTKIEPATSKLPHEDRMRRAEVIRKNIKSVEDGLAILLTEEMQTERLARERNWHIRFPVPHGTMLSWIRAKRRRITRIRYWIREIRSELPSRLYRIKIRLYNEERKPTPTGMFQGFFDIDAVIDPKTELVNWGWWLTILEVNIAKYHMVGYFKGMAKWREPDQMELAYFDQTKGIPAKDETASYKRTMAGVPYAKNVPAELISKIEALTIKQLIVGESSKEPEPNPAPSPENMGVFVQRFMVITEDGEIKWDDIRNKWIWHPPANMMERIKGEL